jgi:hypothetical protein
MKTNETKIDPFENVGKPEQIIAAIKKLNEAPVRPEYLRGVIKFYEKRPPNPYLVPFLRRVLERFK